VFARWVNVQRQEQQQIPAGMEDKKSKSNDNGRCLYGALKKDQP
jgi:hypothetical protein